MTAEKDMTGRAFGAANSPYRNEIPRAFPLERLHSELHPYAYLLTSSGYDRLVPLLDRNIQQVVLGGIEKSLVQTLNESAALLHSQESRSNSLIVETTPQEAKDIRLRVEELLRTEVASKALPIDMIPTLKIIPPKELAGFIEAIDIKKDPNHVPKHYKLTDFGRVVKLLKEKWADLSIFLYHGRAREAADTKPTYRIRDKYKEKAYRIPALQEILASDKSSDKIPSDFDLLAVASPSAIRDLFDQNLENLLGKFKEIFKYGTRGWAKIIQGTRRPDFTRIDFGPIGKNILNEFGLVEYKKRDSMGHLFGPTLKEKYDLQNPLLSFLMESARVDIPVLLVPYYQESTKEWSFWGVAVDFFGGFEDVDGKNLAKQRWLGKEFIHAHYPFPEVTFPIETPRQLMFNLGYAIRTWAWDDKQPVITLPGEEPITDLDLAKEDSLRNKLKHQSKVTQYYLSENIIKPISLKLVEDSSSLGDEFQRQGFGVSLLEDISVGLDGDAVATLLRLLPVGSTLTKGESNFFETNTDIYGFGIFDKQGFFPNIGRLLEDKELLLQVKNRIFQYKEMQVQIAEERDVKNKMSGKKLLFDIVFRLADNDRLKALELLRPVWCSADEWKRISSGVYAERMAKLDNRFKIPTKKIGNQDQILHILDKYKGPIPDRYITGQMDNVSSKSFARALRRLKKKKQITTIGGKLGEGGSIQFVSNPIPADKLEEQKKRFPLLTPKNKIISVLTHDNKQKTIDELCKMTQINPSLMRFLLKQLESEGEITLVGNRFKNPKWELNRVRKTETPLL